MLHTASYFYPNHHIGKLYSVSRSNPNQFVNIPKISILVPRYQTLANYKETGNKEVYIRSYGNQLRQNWLEVKQWLNSLEPQTDITICCWEKPRSFCHRQLIYKLVAKHRPDCLGILN